MKNQKTSIQAVFIFCIGFLAGSGNISTIQAADQEPVLIALTQRGCQFLEPEGKDHQFKTASANDCEKINKESGKERLKTVQPMKLKAGLYTFRVTNEDVPYPLGFWIRGVGFQRITLPSVSGGGLVTGNSKDYQITLKPGKYVYSCPLNPTPDYPVIVE